MALLLLDFSDIYSTLVSHKSSQKKEMVQWFRKMLHYNFPPNLSIHFPPQLLLLLFYFTDCFYRVGIVFFFLLMPVVYKQTATNRHAG